MSQTFDLVVTGADRAALVAAVEAVRLDGRVLLVWGGGDGRKVRRLCRWLRRRAKGDGHVSVMMNAAVVCVDGVDRVEAVVVRDARTGCLTAVNATAFLVCDGRTGPLNVSTHA